MSCVIQARLTCVTPSEALPIEVDYARRHLKAITTSEDVLVEAWIRAAASYFEEQTGRPIMRSTWEYWLDAFPMEGYIELPLPPLQSVTWVRYIGSGDTLVPFSDNASPETLYWEAQAPAGTHARRGLIKPIAGQSWATAARIEPGAVRIRFEAGYAEDASQVPELIKAALLMLVGSFDQFRAESHFSEGARVEQVPFGAEQIIDGFKKTAFPTQVLHRP